MAQPGEKLVGLKALLWDVDGTLAETEFHGHRLAFNQAFADAGLPWRWDEATYAQLLAVSGGRERIRHFLEHHQQGPVSASQVESLMGAKQEAYAALARRGELPLRPGVKRLVNEVANHGIPQALVTTSSRSAVAALLEGHGPSLAGVFAFWICGEDVTAKKPSPEGYQLALDRLNLSSMEVLVLEDSAQGLEAAQDAALPCLLTLAERSLDSTGGDWWRKATAAVSHLGDDQLPASVLKGPSCQDGKVTVSWLQRLVDGTWPDPH